MSIKTLHQNIDSFSEKITKEYSSQINCKSGCDQCCHVALSVFSIEADYIVEYVDSLSKDERVALKELWQTQPEDGKNLMGESVRPCSFLYDGKCSVYEARPVICRTQGLPMIRKEEDQMELDVCSLNFLTEAPTVEMSFDLNRLNMLLSLAQKTHESKNFQKERVTLNQLRKYLITHIDD